MKQYNFCESTQYVNEWVIGAAMSVGHAITTGDRRVDGILKKYPTPQAFIQGCEQIKQKNPGKSASINNVEMKVRSCKSQQEYQAILMTMCKTRYGLAVLSWLFNPFNTLAVGWKMITAKDADRQIAGRGRLA